MVIDEQFIKNYKSQIDHLTRMKKSIEKAIDEAKGYYDKMVPGKSMEDIFGFVPPQQPDPSKQ